MRLLGGVPTDQRRLLITVALIFVLAASIRFYNIGWSFSNNGVDEGVMLQRSLLVSRGYELYTEVPCDQAPLAFYLGAVFRGDVVTLRALEATLSLLAIGACMLLARRIHGNTAMLFTGLFLAVDFAFLRESRLYSLDGMSSFFLAFSYLAFSQYAKDRKILWLFSFGLLIGISAAVKLLGALGLLGFLLYFGIERFRERSIGRKDLLELAVVLAAAAIPMMSFMLFIGPSEMVQGMLLDQTHREFVPLFKLTLLAYFGLNLTYMLPLLYAREMWNMGPDVRLLFCATAAILAFMIVQPLVFFHHFVLLSPALAVLAGIISSELIAQKKKERINRKLSVVLEKNIRLKKAATIVLVMDIVASGALAFYGVAAQDEPSEIVYAQRLREIMDALGDPEVENQWVICGDPLIATHADRLTPPSVVNVAYRRYPQLTLEDIETAIMQYNVSVVVVAFRLKYITGLQAMLLDLNFSMLSKEWVGHGGDTVLDLFEISIDPVYFYVKNDIVEQLGLPLETSPRS